MPPRDRFRLQRRETARRRTSSRRLRPAVEVFENRTLLSLITVNSADDTNSRDGVLTLREAILYSNGTLDFSSFDVSEQGQIDTGASIARNTIEFNIGGGGTPVAINLGSSLSQISVPVFINGTTQIGPAATSPGISVDGQGGISTGFEVNSAGGGSEIRGLAIGGFTDRAIYLNVSVGNVVAGNHLGTDITGTVAFPNGDGSVTDAGVRVNGGSANTIGGTNVADRNIISGNNLTGIFLTSSAQSVSIIGNYIGLDVTGTVAIPNLGEGMRLDASPTNNVVGGPTVAERNVISGNGTDGITIRGDDNSVYGNFIGTDVTGTVAIPNGASGIYLQERTSDNNMIGGANSVPGVLEYGNLISGNTGAGLTIIGTSNFAYGNFIGTDVTGTVAIPNAVGVSIEDDPDDSLPAGAFNTIGGTNAAPGVLGLGNLISGNTGAGLSLSALSSFNNVLGNFIGTDVGGSSALPNGGAGIAIASTSQENNVGQANATVGELTSGNLVSGNAGDGISVDGTLNTISGNFVGTDATGLNPLANAGPGVRFSPTAYDNTAGGPAGDSGNKIAFSNIGVLVDSSTGNAIRSNSMSGNVGGAIVLQNSGNNDQAAPVLAEAVRLVGYNYVFVRGTLNSVADESFMLQVFGTDGLLAGAQGEQYLGELAITTDGSGTSTFSGVISVPSAAALIEGMAITATVVRTGGDTSTISAAVPLAITDTVVTNIDDDGEGSLRQAIVVANRFPEVQTIRFAIDGSGPHVITPLSPLPDISDGVTIDGSTEPDFLGVPVVVLDGLSAGAGADGLRLASGSDGSMVRYLVIQRFDGDGIEIASDGNWLVANFIGTDPDLAPGLGNGLAGVRVNGGSGSTIGGPNSGEGNWIFGNAGAGVAVVGVGASGNAVLGNSIDLNGGLGIDLGDDGVTPNDELDPDDNDNSEGPNRFQNFPVLASVLTDLISGSTFLGTFNSLPETTFRIEFFGSPAAGASGATFLAFVDVTTDIDGNATIDVTEPALFLTPGTYVTATATRLDGVDLTDTSEFSEAELVLSATATALSSDAATATYGDLVIFTATITSDAGTPTGDVAFYDGSVGPGNLLGTGTLDGLGVATFATSTLSATGSPYNVLAVYAGEGTFAASESAPYAQTVNQANLVITAADQFKTYGEELVLPGAGFLASGLVNGDAVSGVALASAGAVASADVAGSPYAISASDAVGTGLDNYAISYVDGSLFVAKATLTVTADDRSRTYGGDNPAFAASFAGFVNGEDIGTSGVTGAPGLSTPATPASPVAGGPYPITASAGSLASDNYAFAFVDGALNVVPAFLTIAAGNQVTAFGSPLPNLAASYYGLVNGDTPADLDVPPTLQTTATVDSPVAGSPYPITVGGASDSNYVISHADGVMIVTTAETATTLAFSDASPASGQPVTMTATVWRVAPGVVPPAGVVQFWEGDVWLATVPVVDGSASFTTSSLAVGVHNVTALYEPSGDDFGSSVVTQSMEVRPAEPAVPVVTLTPLVNPSRTGVELVAWVGQTSGGPQPTGTVTYFVNGTPFQTLPLVNGSTSRFVLRQYAVGRTFVAQYNGGPTARSEPVFISRSMFDRRYPSRFGR